MSRRTALPGAEELFRSTEGGRSTEPPLEAAVWPLVAVVRQVDALEVNVPAAAPPWEDERHSAARTVRPTARHRPRAVADRQPSGRERHDEKITVYVSADELLDLEHARLTLRGDHGLPVDRGRVVREALAVVLADFEAKGEASILVRRLRGH